MSNLFAKFLDLDISIVNGRFKYKLFDKRNAPEYKTKSNTLFVFPLGAQICPVKCFTRQSVPKYYVSVEQQRQRMISITPFLSCMHKQGALEDEIGKYMNKLLDRHEQEFKKFGINKAKVKNFVVENLH